MSDKNDTEKALKKRNLVLGLSLFAMVVFIAVVSYYKIQVVTP